MAEASNNNLDAVCCLIDQRCCHHWHSYAQEMLRLESLLPYAIFKWVTKASWKLYFSSGWQVCIHNSIGVLILFPYYDQLMLIHFLSFKDLQE
jgi:hypothetical protein